MEQNENWIKLESISIRGFRSIEQLDDFRPQAMNVLIGPNGAGKTNFIRFFTFFSYLINGKLQEHVNYLGGSEDVLFDGTAATETLSAHVALRTASGLNEYAFTLRFAKPDTLQFIEEKFRFSPNNLAEEAEWTPLGSAHLEARLTAHTGRTASTVRNVCRKLIVHQFHNTDDTSMLRRKWAVDDGRHLKAHGQNLAAFLWRMQRDDYAYYNRVRKYVQTVLPFFDDFEFYDEHEKVMLRWKENGTDKVFNAGQASDGMLRVIALIAMLAQKSEDLPAVLFLDEPELGLHPAAINAVAGLLGAASLHCQVFLATQSVTMVSNFSPDEVVVVERKGRESTYIRQSAENLNVYLEDFDTGEIWERNIIGGRP